jgi:alanine-synthesizing transaminase
VNLSNGKPVHYICDEASDWYPDLADIESKITSRTKGIVIINPNNPTGAVYNEAFLRDFVKMAERHKLIVFSDEIYDKILYDHTVHHSTASFGNDTLFVTYGGLSKAYRACGFRAGWMIMSGNLDVATDYLNGLNTLASMRLCSNVPAQYAIQTALGGYQSINDLVLPEGRLTRQRDLVYNKIQAIDGLSCNKPKGAFYMFPKIDLKKFSYDSDLAFVMDLLRDEHILFVQGSGFNWIEPDHFRIVFLPHLDELEKVMNNLAQFLSAKAK